MSTFVPQFLYTKEDSQPIKLQSFFGRVENKSLVIRCFCLVALVISVLYCSYADRDQLQAIYSAYLQPVLSSSLKSHPVWGAVKNVHTLAGSMVSVYEQVSVTYLISPIKE